MLGSFVLGLGVVGFTLVRSGGPRGRWFLFRWSLSSFGVVWFIPVCLGVVGFIRVCLVYSGEPRGGWIHSGSFGVFRWA